MGHSPQTFPFYKNYAWGATKINYADGHANHVLQLVNGPVYPKVVGQTDYEAADIWKVNNGTLERTSMPDQRTFFC